jgi:hypothetical protein
MYACAYAYEVSRAFIYHICILHSRSLVQHVRETSVCVEGGCSVDVEGAWRVHGVHAGGCRYAYARMRAEVAVRMRACGRRSLCVCAHAGGGRCAYARREGTDST